MSVKARINHVNIVKEGDSVGYNLTWEARRESRLACVPIGYADGVDRRLSNRMEGLILGQKVRQVGLISMDQMLFDITDVPEAQDGDVITLIGRDESAVDANKPESALHLATWAEMLGTITYELASRLRTRLPRIYTRLNKTSSGSSVSSSDVSIQSDTISSKQSR
jgi:alanine racemase